MTVFLARGLKPGKAQPEEDERIEHQLVPLSQVVKLILSGNIRDGKTIASVLWFQKSRKSQTVEVRRQRRCSVLSRIVLRVSINSALSVATCAAVPDLSTYCILR